MENQYLMQIVVGYIAPYVLEFLKKAAWFPALTENSTRLVKIAWAWIFAAASAIGVTFVYDPVVGQVVISGLSLAAIGTAFINFVLALMTQKLTYRVVLKPAAGGGV